MNKLIHDFLPLIVFFVAYKIAGIYTATALAIGVSAGLILLTLALRKPVGTAQWINLFVISLFGGATLFFHNETFIKWKPTVLYLGFAAILLGARWLFQRNLMHSMLGKQLEMADSLWDRMNLSWALFFIFLGILNLIVAYSVPTAVWVNFKVFGLLGLLIVFIFIQSFYFQRLQRNPSYSTDSKSMEPASHTSTSES